MSPRETTRAMLNEEEDDDASRMQSSVASSSAATVQELTGILSTSDDEAKPLEPVKANELPRKTSAPKKKFPSNEPRNMRRGSAKTKLESTRKNLSGKIRSSRSPLRHSTGNIEPLVEGEKEGSKRSERRKSNDSASIGLPGRADRSWQGWAEVSETSSGWSDVYRDDDDSLEDFDDLDGNSVPFVDKAEARGVIEEPIIIEKAFMGRSQSAPSSKDVSKADDEDGKSRLRTKSSSKKVYSALDDDDDGEVENLNTSGFSVSAIMRRSHSVPPKVEAPGADEAIAAAKDADKKARNAKLIQSSLHDSSSSLFSVSAFLKRSQSVPPKVEVRDENEPTNNKQIKSSTKKASKSVKSQDTRYATLAQSLKNLSLKGSSSHKEDANDGEPAASQRPSLNKVRGRSSNRKLTSSAKLQESQSSGISQTSKTSLPKNKDRRSHSVPSQVEQPKLEKLLQKTQPSSSEAGSNKVRGRSSNRKVATSSKPSKMGESQSSGMSGSSKKSLPHDKLRRSHSVPTEAEVPKVESLLKEPEPKLKGPSSDKLRGRSSNSKVATSSKSKMGQSESSGMSNSSRKSLPKDKVRRSLSVPSEVEEPKREKLLLKPKPPPSEAEFNKMRGRSSNRKVATSSKSSKLDESQSSAISHGSKTSLQKSKMKRSQSVPSEVEDKLMASASEKLKPASKPLGKEKTRGQSSNRKLSGSARMQDSSSTGVSVASKKSITKDSRKRSQSVPSPKDLPKTDDSGPDKPNRPSSKERARERPKTKKLSGSSRLDDSYSTVASKKSSSTIKDHRRRSQSVPSPKDFPKSGETEAEKPRPSSKERAKTKKLSRSGRLEDSQSTGLSLSSHQSHKSAAKRSQSVPARKDNSDSSDSENIESGSREIERDDVRRHTPIKTKYPSRRRDSSVPRVNGRAQSLSTLRSRNTALTMFNKSNGSAQPFEQGFCEDETRRMVKEAGFLEASEYIGNTRSKSLGRSTIRQRGSITEKEPKMYLPPNPPRNGPDRRWSLTDLTGKIEVKEKERIVDDESSIGKRQTVIDSLATPSASRPKLTKAAVQKQRRSRSQSQNRNESGRLSTDSSIPSSEIPNVLSPRSIDESDTNDSDQKLLENITISDIMSGSAKNKNLIDRIKEDASLSLTDRWETVPHAIPFPDAEFPEPEWDNRKLNASDGRISSSSRTTSPKSRSDKKNKSEGNLNTSRKERKKSPHGEGIKESVQRKRQSNSQSRSRSRSQADRARLDGAVATSGLSKGLSKEEDAFHRSAESMIRPKDDPDTSGDSDGGNGQRPKPRTSNARASLVALYGGPRALGGSENGAEISTEDKKSRLSGSVSPERSDNDNSRGDGTDEIDMGLYDGNDDGELAIQSETGPRLRHIVRRAPKDRIKDRESMKRDARSRLAKERNRPTKATYEEDDDFDLANKSDGELTKSDAEVSLEKSPSKDSRGARKKANGRNPQQQQRNRRNTVSQDMLHQSVTSMPSLEPMPAPEKANTSSGVNQMQSIKEQPWQRRRRLSIGGDEQ